MKMQIKSIRFPLSVWKALKIMAHDERRSVGSMIRIIVESAIATYKAKQ